MAVNIEKELKQLDFTENEIKVYKALFRTGKAKAGRIAKECSLERTSTYNAIKRLLEKGVITSIREGKIQTFSHGKPEKLLSMLEEKQEVAKLLVEQLKTIQKYEEEKENILKFRGFNGVKTVLQDVLKTCRYRDEYLLMGTEGQLSKELPTFAKIYVAKKDAKKIRTRLLMSERNRGPALSKYTKIKYVPEDVVSPANMTIYKEKVSLIIWTETPEAIIIDNKEVANTFRSYFEFMWKHAKE